MSNLENITKKILDDASLEAEQILSKAKAQGQELIDGSCHAAQRDAEKTVEKARLESALIEDRVRTGAQREARDRVLAAKQSVADRAFVLAKEALKNLPQERYAAVIDRYFAENPVTQKLILELPEGRTYQPASDQVQVVHSGELKSGFRLIRGGVRTNYDFETLVDYVRDSLEAEVVHIVSER